MVKTEFIKLYEELNSLTESKQDTANFINFFMNNKYIHHTQKEAEDWTTRFDKIKHILKSPENDYYYWIKKGDVREVVDTIKKAEHDSETKKLDKRLVAEGAHLINETEHWKIYHITNYEASRTYGRDATWCITGINNYGSRYWDDYRKQGFSFYFIIAKENYDSRGTDSKFAFAVNHNNRYYEIYNQQDDKVDSLEDVPYYEEIDFSPDFDITDYTIDTPYYCEECGDPIHDEDDVYRGPNGEILCDYCFERYYFYCNDCGDVFSNTDGYEGADGNMYCADCWNDKFFECQNCGDTFDRDECCYSEEDWNEYCPDCYAELFPEEEEEESDEE